MALKATWFRDRLKKKAGRGFRGYPVASVAYYGPDNLRASKVAVGITYEEGGEPELKRWFSERGDIRADASVNEELVHFLRQNGVKSVVSPDRILGCPHEEGIDYRRGEKCAACPFWADRDRFTGEISPA